MNLHQHLEFILQTQEPHEKLEMFETFYDAYKKGEVVFEEAFTPKEFEIPSYAATCQVVAPQNVPKRSNLTTKEGQIYLLHAIAHIEYSAIDLALDAAYRFVGMPKEFYDDWLLVADDEVRHFIMLEKLLEELGAKYGSIVVHNALFEASQRTQTLLERMAVVPRYLEANGLDATPMILEKLSRLVQTPMIEKIQESLKIILEEEVDHVKKGDYWFNWACKKFEIYGDVYFEIIDKYYPQGFARAKNLNLQARKEAGFSCDELNFMAHKKVCEK